MKPLRWILTVAASVVIGLILTSWLSRPIDDFFRGDRIEAELTIGPWHPLPVANESPKRSTLNSDELSQALAQAEEASRLAEKAFRPNSLAKLTLSNKSEKVISNIRVKFISTSDIFFDSGNEKTDKFSADLKSIEIPDMKPGDEFQYYIWTNLYSGPETFVSQLETFSSTGAFRLQSRWSKEQTVSGFEQFMDDWAGVLLFFALLSFVFVFAGYAVALEAKIKGVLVDGALYQREKDRFELDPAKYNALEASSPELPPSSP